MKRTLNIVNGDACINIMKKADIQGDFLPWLDFLHEGSVPAGLNIELVNLVRFTIDLKSVIINLKSIESTTR